MLYLHRELILYMAWNNVFGWIDQFSPTRKVTVANMYIKDIVDEVLKSVSVEIPPYYIAKSIKG